MKMRLLLTERCNRNCAGCCNKQFDLSSLPDALPDDYKDADLIMMTGGEPMLDPMQITTLVKSLRFINVWCPIYLYTANVTVPNVAMHVLSMIDGMTLTIHDENDIAPFLYFNHKLTLVSRWAQHKSLRLNIFKEASFHPYASDYFLWKDIRYNMEWIEDCPLPQDEVFLRA